MISSIFNSRAGLSFFLCLAVVLLLGEGSLKMVEDRLSWDLTHWREMPDILGGNLSRSNGRKILFLGNSLTRTNIHEGLVEEELKEINSGDFKVARIFPDDTTMVEWPYILRSQSLDTSFVPDTLIILFSQEHLQDSPLTSEIIRRIGYFSSLS